MRRESRTNGYAYVLRTKQSEKTRTHGNQNKDRDKAKPT